MTAVRLLVLALPLAVATSESACASSAVGGDASLAVPDYPSYVDAGIDDFLARRCGTLDCHGQPGRPLRLYGQTGLRSVDAGAVEAGVFPGGVATTELERYENYKAVVGLEPELLARVAAHEAPAFDLLLVRKPLDYRHKGGPVIASGDDGETCIVRWVTRSPSRTSCDRAARGP